MSQGFGVDVYGIPFYGYSQPVQYSVTPFTATQADYGEITLQWSSPNTAAWKYLQLIRSTYGYPSTAQDGVLLQQFTVGTIQKTYDDAGLTPGVIYYYTMFITLEAPTWNSTTNYILNTQVLYNGQYWTSLNNVNLNQTPVAGGSYWASSAYVPSWLPAGYAATLALANDGYGTLLYNRSPQPYKIAGSDTFSDTAVDNPSLQHYFNVMGFGLSQVKNDYDSYLSLNNPDVVSATNLDILGQQLGIQTDYMSTPQQRRQRIKTATVNYQLKGEPQSIHNLIAQLTGWDSSITDGPNLLTSADQTAFVSPNYSQWNANITYFPNALIQYNGYNYKCQVQAVGTAQAPTGANSSNTWWSVQVQQLDTTTLLNPKTGFYSTWGNFSTVGSGFVLDVNGIETGLPSPLDSAINNYNALSINSSLNSSSTWNVFNYAYLATPSYSNSTNYVINNVVLYTDGVYYIALKPSGPGTPYGAQIPGHANTFWHAFYYVASDIPNLIPDSAPLAQLPTWNAVTKYAAGTEVQYQGFIYYAVIDNVNETPSGNYYSTPFWACLGAISRTVAMSGWLTRASSNANTATMNISPAYYDKTGKLITNYSTFYASLTNPQGSSLLLRFPYDYTDINTKFTEPSLINANGTGFINNSWITGTWAAGSWTPTSNLWETSYGTAWVNQTTAGTTELSVTLLNTDIVGGRIAVTFASDYNDPAHYSNGLAFLWNTTSTGTSTPANFYYVTRQSLWYVNGSTETKLASWTPLNTGDRIVVDTDSSLGKIQVYKYARDSAGTLTQLANVSATVALGSGNVLTGLIQKYSATGAL